MKLLMVCLGNICRSPIAEGLMKAKLKNAGLDYMVDSAGILSSHAGETPDHRAVEAGKNHGVDISTQVARKFSKSDFEKFDFIFAMDESVYEDVISLAKTEDQKNKVNVFLDFADWHETSNVPDPYYGTQSDFEDVYQLIDVASDKIVEKFMKGKF